MTKIDKHINVPDNFFKDDNVLITGSTSGIGAEAAKHVAKNGGNVYLHGRNEERGQELEEKITKEHRVSCEFIRADLSNMNEVRSIKKRLEDLDKLDYLINNAGAFIQSDGYALSDLQETFVVNHMSHFLLTKDLLPLLRKSDNPRIVNTASEAHRSIDDFNIPQDIRTKENGWKAYCRSKACNIMFTYKLREELDDIDSVSIHPGVIPGSGFMRNLPGPLDRLGSIANKIPFPGVDSKYKGAAMLMYGMTVDPDKSAYLSDFDAEEPSDVADNEQNREDLWNFSMNELGVEGFSEV